MTSERSMSFRKITAIIRSEVLENVEQALQEMGVPGISVTSVKGYGEYANFYSRDWMTTHARLEIFTTANREDAIVRAIMAAAHSGVSGDGIVAVLPVEKVYKIRNQIEAVPDEL